MAHLASLIVSLLIAVALGPGESLQATCAGQFTNVQTGTTAITADCVELPPPATTIIVDHDDIAQFDSVPISLVSSLRVMSVDRSVGWNISNGLGCLTTAIAASPSYCKRSSWPDGSYATTPMVWTAHPLPNWRYFGWPGSGIAPELPCSDPATYIRCFESYVTAHAAEWDAVSMQPSYLDAGTYQLPAADYLAAYDRLKAAHPGLAILLHTASLARTIGTQTNHEFNEAVRAHVAQNGGVLIDIADIESHDPDGTLNTLNGWPIISPYYTSEVNGGHLGYPSVGMIRLAEAWWIALAQAQGW